MSGGPPFSAGDVEKFSYCPLSWWLGRGSLDTASRAATDTGSLKHRGLSDDLLDLSASQRSVSIYSRMIMYYALISTFIAVLGVSLLDFNGKQLISRLLLLLAVIWVVIAISLLYLGRKKLFEVRLGERWTAYTASAGVIFAVISISTLQVSTQFAQVLESASLIWLIGASVFLYFGLNAEKSAAAIATARRVAGTILYVGDERHPVLFSKDGLFSGKPDFILEEEGHVIPCEFKSGRRPAAPFFSHMMQLSVYCRLVESNYGTRPDYGYIYYGTKRHVIDFDSDMEKLLLTKAQEMERCLASNQAHRNHGRSGKCANCSRRSSCPERLA